MKHFKIVFQKEPSEHFTVYPKSSPGWDDQLYDEIMHHKKTYGGVVALVIVVIVMTVFCCCCRKDKNSAVQMNKTVDIEPFTMEFDDIRAEDSAK